MNDGEENQEGEREFQGRRAPPGRADSRWHYRRKRALPDGRPDEHAGDGSEDAVRKAFGRTGSGRSGRPARCVSITTRPGPSIDAWRNQLPRKYLRAEDGG